MKKLALLALTVFMTVSLFAQNAKSTGLTDKDVRNFAKNFNALTAEFDDAFGDSEDTSYVQKKSDYIKAQKILAKYGFTGTNSVEKFAMMSQCIGVVSLEKSGALELYKSMGMANPLEGQMQNISKEDYQVVERNWDAIAEALNYEGLVEEEENYRMADKRRQEEEENDYQAQVDDMMSSLMGMLGSSMGSSKDKGFAAVIPVKKQNNKNIKGTFDSEVKVFKDYLKKFDSSSKKDIGFIYKKYDKANASKYKLESKNSMNNYMTSETGYTFMSYSNKLEGTSAEVYFKLNTIGAAVYYTMDKDDASDYVESTKTNVDKWDIYSCGSGREIVYYFTDGRTVHVWMDANDESKAVLETDTIKLEGQYSYSPF